MIVLGHCLASDDALTERLRGTRATRRPDRAFAEWPGCYSLLIMLSNELVLLTDPVGQFPLYTATAPEGTWFGSSSVELAGRVAAEIDRESLAMSISCVDVLNASENRSAFLGVHRLPPGGMITVNSAGISVEPLAPLAVDEEMTFSAAAEQLRLSLLEAVAARVSTAGSITADLSGGIDSSALVFLGLDAGAEISGFTSYHFGGEVEDDLAWARRFAGLASGLTHHLVPTATEDLPFSNLVASTEMPHPSPLAVGPLRARLRLAAKHGSTIHLVGEGGDLVLSAPPAYLADLVRRGAMTALWRQCLRWGRIRQCSPWALLRRATALAATSRRQALHSLAATIEHATPTEDKPPWQLGAVGYWEPPRPHWLTRRARGELAGRVRAIADESTDELGVADAVTMSQLRTQVMTERTVRDVGQEFGVDVHAPYLDTAVVRACLSLPAYRRADPAVAKPVLRSALTGLVPGVVLNRPTKGSYTRSSFLGVRQAAPALRRLLAESVAADHGLLDPVPVRAVLERAIQGRPTPWRALNQVLAVELWLRDVSRKVAGV